MIFEKSKKIVIPEKVPYCFEKVLPLVSLEAGIQKPDVIRYARLLTNLA